MERLKQPIISNPGDDIAKISLDIKCENLLFDKNFNIKLTDFGFARCFYDLKTGHSVLSETFCGSYAYASPEILRGIPYEPQMSDVWSLGVVLFAMVFGRLPFDDSNYSQLIKQVSNKVVFPKQHRVTVTCKLLISKILAPLKIRIKISEIRLDNWFINMEVNDDKNIELKDALPPPAPSLAKHIEKPVELFTKDQLKIKNIVAQTTEPEVQITDSVILKLK